MPQKKHKDTLILRALLDDLTVAEQIEFDAWLQESPANQRRYVQIQQTWQHGQLLQDWESLDLERNWEAILVKAGKQSGKTLSLQPILRYAAAAIVLCFVGFWLLQQFSTTTVTNDKPLPIAYELPDGSILWLKQNAEVSFQARNFTKERTISMHGEVFFEVQKGLTPFVVTANESQVKVLGTSFNMKEDEGQTTVLLLEGAVRFATADTATILSPDECATYDGHQLIKSSGIDKNDIGWKTGRFNFLDEPLHQVMQLVADYYGITYTIAPELKDLLVTTTLNQASLPDFIASFTFILNIKIDRQEQHLNLYQEGL